MADFRVNYQAGERLRDGADLYRTEDGHFMFKYLPFSALLYLPLSLLPLEVAKVIWYVALVCGSLILFHLSRRMARVEDVTSVAAELVPALMLAKFFLREMKLGQINVVVTVALLGMVWFLISTPEGRPRGAKRAGLLWGLGTALKPYGAIFFPYFVVKQQWATLAVGCGTLLTALFLPSIFYGFGENLLLLRQWASTLSESTPTLLLSNDNVSIVAFFMKWTGNRELSLLLTAVAVGALAVLVLLAIRTGARLRQPVVLECSLLLTLIPLVSPLGWDYTLLMSVLAVTILVKNYRQYANWARLVFVVNSCIVALSIYDLIGPRYYGAFMEWSILTINFLIVVGFLLALRFRKLA